MKTIKYYFVILCVFVVVSCAPNIPVNIRSLMVTSNDVPQGWISNVENFSNEWGGTEYIIGFNYGDEILSPGIAHHMIVYPDEASAIDGYKEYRDFIYQDFWHQPQEVLFSPSVSSDLYEYKCDDSLKINGQHILDCLILQQHKNYVSVVDARMGEPYLTFDTLNSILRSIDEKLNTNE